MFEGTSLYSLRLDHNLTNNNRLTLRANVSPSTVTGIEVNGENQVFGQNAFSRTSQQTYRDAAGMFQDTWTIGNNRINEFRFQYARRGLAYFYSSAPGGSDVGSDITGFAYIGREPYSYVQRVEQRYQFTDNYSWTLGRHATKFGADFNYIPLKATFTVNYGGVYSFSGLSASSFGFPSSFPQFNAVQAYGLGLPQASTQGIGNPLDSFSNKPIGLFWQDSWRVRPNLTLNYGVRYDLEFPPQLAAPTGLALAGYNQLGLQKGIQTDKKNIQPRIGVAFDPKGDGKTVIRASFGMFFDHPLLGLYFLGDASDGFKLSLIHIFENAAPRRILPWHFHHIGRAIADCVQMLEQLFEIEGFTPPQDARQVRIVFGRSKQNGRRRHRRNHNRRPPGGDLPQRRGAFFLNFRMRRQILKGKHITRR